MTKEIAIKYDTVWEQVLDMAKDVLASRDLEKAQKMVRPFLWDKRKKDAFAALQVNIADIKHFESLVEQDSFITAFKFADEKQHLQTIKSYEKIQDNFNKKFQVAKNLFTKESRQDIQNAKNILTPYLKIDSKKSLINNLMQNYKVFSRSSRLIKARNFKVYFRLVENNDFLKDENLYAKIVEIGNQTYSKLLKLEQEGDYNKANQIATYLEDFTPFTEQVIDVKEVIQSKVDLQSLILTENTKLIYEKISLSNELELSSIFTEYHKIYEEKKEVATFFANEGESPKVMRTLEEHLGIDYLLNSIAMVFKLSYLIEIENKMQSDPSHTNMRETLERYAILYGIDDDLHFLAKKMNFTQLVPNYPPNAIGFKTHDFFENIVVSA
ncbi:MAG: hypothetical protein Q9M32_00495 [Sulfurimonas sp.]|nr:hypothetical protein [Sulfurimonas sp.]